MGEPAYQLPEEDKPDIRPDLRSLEGGGTSTPREDGQGSAVPDAEDDEGTSSGGAGRHLRTLEGGAGKDSGGNEGDLFNKEGDDPKQLGRLSGTAARYRNSKNKLLHSIGKHKWLWGLGAGALGSIGGFLLILFILLAALKIPHLAENITEYQFARVFQQAAETNDRVISEKVAVDAADQGIYGKLKAKYDAAGTKASEKWSKFTLLQPNKVLNNMDKSNTLRFNYKQTTWGGQKIASVTMGNSTALVNSKTTAQKLLPAYDFAKGLGSENINLVQQYQTAMKEGFRAQEIGPITRGLTAKEIRARLGISLTAWAIAKYKNLSEQKAALQEARDAHTRISTPDTQEPTTASLKDAEEKVKAAEEKGIASDTELPKIIANGGRDTNVEKVMADSVKTSGFDTALGIVNPAYAIATPACIVFDGSLDHSGSTVDANVNAQIKEYSYIATAADQQKDGTNASENAVGALNNRLGDYSDSAPIQRATNNASYVPPTSPSAEASSMGTFTVLSALLGGGKVVDVVNKMAGTICPGLTNIYAASGIAIVNIILTIFTLGGTEGAEQTVLQTVRLGVEKAADKIVETVTTKAGAKLTAGKTASFLGDSLKTGVKIAGVTLAAKAIVLSKSGYANNGIDTSNDTANNSDAGGNLLAQEVDREQFYGRPLDKTETNVAANQSLQLAYSNNQSKSAYQRYFALSNANSMLTLTATAALGSLHRFSLSNFVGSLGDKIGSPLSFLGGAILGTNHSMAFAANSYNSDMLNHGNVQFGWSTEETKLAKQPAYGLLENQRILDASGQEDEIASTYGKCFDGGTTIGTLLQDPDNGIARDDNGNVIDNQGTCSPQNLGPHNPSKGDLVFRYRLAQRDDKGLDTVLDQQTISEDTAANTPSNFTVATYNLLNADSHPVDSKSVGACDTKGDPVCMKARTALQAQFITGNANTPQIDIIATQETSPGQFRELTSDLGSSYAAVPDTEADINRLTHSANGGTSIIWNTAKFKKVGEGKYDNLSNVVNQPGGGHITAPYAVLQPVNGGQNIYVTSIHYPNSQFGGTAAVIHQASAMTMAWVQSVKAKDPGALILIGGDFNDSPAQKLSYCDYTQQGLMQNVYDLQNGKDGVCPSAGDHSGGFGGIDNVYINQKSGLTASDYTHVASQGIFAHASDHTPVYATLSSPNTGGGSSFGVATYNIRVPGQVSSGPGSAPVDQRATRAAQLMNSQGVDIIGFQEILTATRQALNKSLTGFASFPTGTKDGPDTSSLLPIYWRTSRFKKIDEGLFATFRPGCSGITLCAKAPWVELEDINTGQKVYVSSVHLLNQPNGHNGGGPQREASANEMVTWANNASSAGIPVVMLGDYNSDYRPSPDDVDIGMNVNRIPYCIFSRAGYVDSYDAVNHNTGYCPSKTKTFAELPYRIDHVYVSAKFASDVTSEKRLINADTRFISDHNPTIATISIPGSGGQGSSPQSVKGGWQWPVAKADYNGLSQCFFKPVIRGDTVVKTGHTGIDITENVGVPVYAAHDGTVVKIDPAGTSDGGKYIIIKHGNKLFSNYQHNSQILVHQGQQVKAGDKIALSGNTGFTTGPHVHFSITTQAGLDSRFSVAYSVDPIPYLPSDRDTGSCQ